MISFVSSLPPATCHLPQLLLPALLVCLCCICHTIQQLWPSTLCFSLFNSFGYWTRLSLRCWLSSLLHCCLGWRLEHLGNLSQTLCESYKFAPQFVQNFWATLGCNSLTRRVPLLLLALSLYSLSLHSQYLLHKRSTKINVQMGRIRVPGGGGGR